MSHKISDWLVNARLALTAVSGDAAIWEAMRLLEWVLGWSPVTIYQRLEQSLTVEQFDALQAAQHRRQQGEPLAYITGEERFWNLALAMNKAVLIPRPETELLVEIILSLFDQTPRVGGDLGTGSGAIVLAIASERPDWTMVASDCSQTALAMAQLNAKKHRLDHVQFFHGDWLAALPQAMKFDFLVSNPPYVEKNSIHLDSAVAYYEPAEALYADYNGLKAIMDIIKEAPYWLNYGGWLFLEHGFNQAEQVKSLMKDAGFNFIETKLDFYGHSRVTLGQYQMHK